MSGDENTEEPARDRREAVREKAQQVHAKQARAHRIRVGVLGIGIVAVVAVVAVVVTWAVTSSTGKPVLTPPSADGDGFAVTNVGAVTVASNGVDGPVATDQAQTAAVPTPTPTAKPTVDIRIYVDYLSPGSADFQLANATQLSTWVSQGAATLTYYPVAMLTAKSNGTKYSLRAAAASACVATHAPDAFYSFNDALLKQQPDVDADGYSDTQLAEIAQAAGVSDPKKVRACIEDGDFVQWAKKATERAVESIPNTDGLQLTGTPLVLVNGSVYVGAIDDPQEFSQFVLTIDSDTYYKTPSPTPTPAP